MVMIPVTPHLYPLRPTTRLCASRSTIRPPRSISPIAGVGLDAHNGAKSCIKAVRRRLHLGFESAHGFRVQTMPEIQEAQANAARRARLKSGGACVLRQSGR